MGAALFVIGFIANGFASESAKGPTALLCVLGVVVVIATSFAMNAKRRKLEEDVKNSEAYQAQCRAAEAKHAARLKETEEKNEAQYKKLLEEYENVELPTYEKLLAFYKKYTLPEWEEELSQLRLAIRENKAALDEVYSRNIIPSKYRNVAATSFLSAFMGTSQYDLKFALERYDNEIEHNLLKTNNDLTAAQGLLLQDILSDSQYANYLNSQMMDSVQEANRALTSISRWTAADAVMHGYDILHRRRLEKQAKRRN